MKLRYVIPAIMLVALAGCETKKQDIQEDINTMRIGDIPVNASFIGNGPQWGGYDMVPGWTGQNSLSEKDWETLFKRVSFMRPGMMRIMVSRGWNYWLDGQYNPSKSDEILCRMLQYCQDNGVTVQLGEWGHEGGPTVDKKWVDEATSFLSYLVKDKGFTCIRYYTIVNEPNGDWSTTDGNYPLWSKVVTEFHSKMEEKGLLDQVDIMGPDAAVWSINETSWMTNTRNDLHETVTAYDIHTYPDDVDVSSTAFSQLLLAFRAASDKTRPITLGELGFKYDADSPLGRKNAEMINADPYAATDSQMNVYFSFYGIDMADATIQAMRSGYSGTTYWMLDDAMYNDTGDPSSTKLKKWGYWNILGEEKFGDASDENIRPWYYTTSLLCRFFPKGCGILDVQLPKPVLSGLRAVAGEKDGSYTIAIVNNSSKEYSFTLKADSIKEITGLDMYEYIAGKDEAYEGKTDENGLPLPKESGVTLSGLDSEGLTLTIPADSFVLYTNMK